LLSSNQATQNTALFIVLVDLLTEKHTTLTNTYAMKQLVTKIYTTIPNITQYNHNI